MRSDANTQREEQERQTERERSKRDKQREAVVRFGNPGPMPQQHLGWCQLADLQNRKTIPFQQQTYLKRKWVTMVEYLSRAK